jgi:lipopolysaccharide export system permease protein
VGERGPGARLGRIDRYILSQLLLVFGLAALVLVMIYWVNRAVMLFDHLISDGQTAWVFLEFTALSLPAIVKLVLPLAAYVAVLIATNRLAGDSELAVMRATGMSPWRLARPVLVFGVLVGATVAVLAHRLEPAAAQRLASREAEIAETATARLLREGEFTSAADGVTVYVAEVSARGEFRGLLLEDRREAARPVTYTAAEAYLVRGPTGPQLVMVDGQIQRTDPAGRLIVTTFADLAYDLGPLLGGGESARRNLRSLPTAALLFPDEAVIRATGSDAGRLRVEAVERFAEMLLPPVAVLIALAAMLQGEFSRLGLWPQIALAVVLAVVVKGVEASVVQASRADPSRWPIVFLPVAGGLAVAAGLLWRATLPRRPRWLRAGRGAAA